MGGPAEASRIYCVSATVQIPGSQPTQVRVELFRLEALVMIASIAYGPDLPTPLTGCTVGPVPSISLSRHPLEELAKNAIEQWCAFVGEELRRRLNTEPPAPSIAS